MDDYGLQHLAEHLYLAKRYDDLHTLVEDRKWYVAKRELDPGHQMYAEDVSHSLSASAHQLENAIWFNDWHVTETQLPTLLAHALLYATVRSQVSRVDPVTLERL